MSVLLIDQLKEYIPNLSNTDDWEVTWNIFDNENIGCSTSSTRSNFECTPNTDRTIDELVFINQVCKIYSDLLIGVTLQYLEVGTYFGASAISACINNDHVKAWTIDTHDEDGRLFYRGTEMNQYSDGVKEPNALDSLKNNIQRFIDDKYISKDSIVLINKNSHEILESDLTEKGLNSDQGINVFFYDGCDGGEYGDSPEKVECNIQIISDTFAKIIPLMSDVCICIFDQKTVSERKPNLSCLFKEVLGEKFTPEQFKEVSCNLPKSCGSSQFHCYLLKKNR